MMKTFRTAFGIPMLLAFLTLGTAVPAQIFWTEDFEVDGEGTTYNTTNYNGGVPPSAVFNDGTSDHFGRTDGTGISGSYMSPNGSFYIAGEDLDDNGGDGSPNKEMVFASQSIVGMTAVRLSALVAQGSAGAGLDATDTLYFQYRVDGGAWTTALQFIGVAAGSNVGWGHDIDLNGVGDDGAALTNTFASFSSDIVVSGSSIEIRMRVHANSASEEFAFDLIQLEDISGAAICGISISGGSESTSCNTVMAGPGDTYDLMIPYSGMDATISVVNNSGSGSVAGDDPAVVMNGTIIIEDIDEADNYDVTFTSPCDAITVSGSAPICEPLPDLIINEILADPTGLDANGDGNASTTQDEFVEVVNNEPTDVDISGYTLSDGVGVKHTFPAGTIVPGGCAIVVFGGGTPTGTFGGALVQTASTGGLGLNNGGDDVTIANTGAITVVTYTYGGEANNDQSIVRDPDVTGTDPLVMISTAAGYSGADFTPGTHTDGSLFSGCTPPACGITLLAESTTCVTMMPGPGDTYDLSIPYIGVQAGVTVINNSGSGTVGGDDPAVTSGGTIVISGISDTDDYDVALSSPCDALTVMGTAPACEPPSPLVINELLADPATGSAGDANGDGTRDGSEDEFIEIINNGPVDADISGYSITDNSSTRHVFPAGTVIPANCGIVVFGGGIPIGTFGGMIVQIASGGLLGMNNSGDVMTLLDASMAVVTSVTYGSEGGADQSLVRSPDITGSDPLIQITTSPDYAGMDFTPGRLTDGTAFSGCSVLDGTVQLLFSDCGKMDLLQTDQIITHTHPDVQAEFGVGDNSDDGYQFLFQDGAGYNRLLFISHANPMTGSPGGPTAAAHLQLDGLVSNPLPLNTVLNVRVRPRANGVNGEFGATCQIMILDMPPTCPTTKLIDDPNNALYSCGITGVTLNGSDKIGARPVAGANRYRFEFALASEGYLRIISIPGYALVMTTWATSPLEYGKTYEVRVQASFDNGANYCPYGDVCTISTAAAPPAIASLRGLEVASDSKFTFWPNPNTGELLNLLVSVEGDMVVQLFDLSGKQVLDRTVPVNGEQVDVSMELPAGLRPGVYLLHARSGEDLLLMDKLVIH